jgi:hypothetical protein
MDKSITIALETKPKLHQVKITKLQRRFKTKWAKVLVNKLRHYYTNYEHVLATIYAASQNEDDYNIAYEIWFATINKHIAQCYPKLSKECFQQISQKVEESPWKEIVLSEFLPEPIAA